MFANSIKNWILGVTAVAVLLLSSASKSIAQSATNVTVGGSTSVNSIQNATATVVDPDLIVTSNGEITNFRVIITGSYTAGDALSYTGTLPSGVTVSNPVFNTTTKSILFSGTTTSANWQTLLRTVRITTSTAVCFPESRQVTFVAGGALYNPLNDHYYTVSSGNQTWPVSRVNAENSSLFGLQGYLATITSSAENSFISVLIGTNTWLGASDDYQYINQAVGYTLYANQSASEGKFYWVTGPEKGTQMTSQNGNTGWLTSTYNNWASGEPNNSGPEHVLHIYASAFNWNDWPETQNTIAVYEYGGMPNDLLSSTIKFTRNIYVNGAPTSGISGGGTSVCAGVGTTTLTINNFTGTVIRWESSLDNFISGQNITTINNTSSTLTVNNPLQTTYYRAIVNVGSCTSQATSPVAINVNSTSTGNLNSENSTICTGGSAVINLFGSNGSVLNWESSPTPTGSWTNISNTTTTLTQILNSPGTIYFRAQVQSSCGSAAYTSAYPITVNSGTPPVGGSVNNVSALCGASVSGTLTLSGNTGSVTKWQSSTDGVVWSDLSANTTTTQAYSSITSQRYYRALITSGSCGTAYSNGGQITFNPVESITIGNSLCSSNNLQWMTMNNITSTTATGSGQNGITVTVTQSGGGMQTNNGMYQPQEFPSQYNIPGAGSPTIQNNNAGNFQACFSQAVTSPVVAFSSIGNPGTAVTVTVSQPYSQVWSGTGTNWVSNTQFIGTEGDNIIRIDGTVTCVNFNYSTSETYCTVAFGFENQNCYTPTLCSGQSVTLTASGASSYAWSPATGLNTTTGATVIANPTTTTTYTVTDPSDACIAPRTITVVVNPIPVATVPSNLVEVTGSIIPSQSFTSTISGSTFAWSNSTPSIGLNASGTGSTPAFTAVNNSSATVISTISVVPTAPNTCSGTAQTFTITVDPTPNVNDPANVTACEGTAVTVDFTGTTSNTNYNWTNDNTSIGLAASGTNDITFTPTNATNVAQTANLTVTPQAYVTQGYVWGQVSENGTLTLNAPAGKVFTTVDFASYGVPTGTIGNWSIGSCHATTSNSVVSAASIGQSTMSIVANNATFGNPCGTTAKTLAVKLGYGVSVTGTSQTFTITVNPNAQIANSSQTICTGTAFTFAPANSDVVPANTSYTWTVAANNNVTGETAQSTATASFSQTLTNTTLLNQNVVYTVTPVSGTGACVGSSFTNTVTVTPLPTSITAAGSTTFCQGGSVSLLAPVAPLNMSYTYQWNLNGTAITGATSSTHIANAAGSYTVTITNNNGCTATSSAVVITVNALPTVNAITGTSALCVGATSALASTTTGGTWSTSNNAIATVNASGVVTAISAGTATITYSVTNSNGCTNTATQVVTINALPTVAAITGANSVCAGSTIQLESATVNGVWSSGNTAVATVGTNGVVTGVSAGVSTISYTVTNSNGCVTSVTADVNVNAVPNSAVVPSGATTFCQGGSVVLTASAGTSYQWSNGAQTQAITVTSGGSYYVNVTNAAGCSVISASQVVTVNPLPAVAAIAGSNNVCVGSTVNLTNATTGGVWSSSNTAVATISSLGIVTGVTSGTSTITYTVTSTAGCTSSSSFLLNVNALPTISPITGLNSVCLGNTVTLSNGTSNGTWSSSNVGIATIAANGVVTGVGVGNAIITYTVTNSFGCVNSISTNMTVNALPTPLINANGPLSFCQGGMVTLTASGGVSYLWSTGANTNSIIADTTGDYSVTVTNSNGCISTTSPTSVIVWDLPIAAISSTGSSICLGSTATLTATGGVNYTWSNGSNNANTTVNSSNTYTVTVTDVNGCTNTASEQVTVNPIPVPVISANGPVTFCSGSSVTLNATGANSFVWSDGTLGSTLNVTQSGTYYVQGTSNAGCTGTSNVIQIVVNPSPVVAAITGANSLCEGTAITLSTATNGGVWSTSNSFIATVNNNGVVTGINAGTTVISYTVSNGSCNTTVSALVTVLNTPATPTITAGGPTSVCPGETVSLFASNAPNYQWNSGQLTNNILVTLSGSYTVSVIGSNGCTATSLPVVVSISDNINPTITAPLNVNVSPNLGCEAIGVALGTPITSDNCSVASVTNDAPAIYPIGTTTVTWTVTDASGNSATATQLVNVVDQTVPQAQAQLDVIVSTTQNCEATNVVLAEPIATDNCTENLTIVNNAPAVFPIGTTVVTWTITDASGNFTTVYQNVIVEDKTAPVVTLQNTAILLNADGTATLSFEQVDNGSYDNCTISEVVLSQSQFDCANVGNNFVTVTITDANGNTSSAEVTVLVIASEACGDDQWNGPNVPEAFTPNGNSINDTWVIPGLEGYNTKQLAVYSRYGTLVYYSAEYQNDWDGTFMGNGVAVPDATYYYILNLDGGKQMSGYVYINRVKQ
jgi:gliding motility-associated-like protein